MARKKKCPGCGTKLLKTARTCDVCSLYFLDCKSPLAGDYEPSESSEHCGINWFKLGMIFFTCITFICVAAFFLTLLYFVNQ